MKILYHIRFGPFPFNPLNVIRLLLKAPLRFFLTNPTALLIFLLNQLHYQATTSAILCLLLLLPIFFPRSKRIIVRKIQKFYVTIIAKVSRLGINHGFVHLYFSISWCLLEGKKYTFSSSPNKKTDTLLVLVTVLLNVEIWRQIQFFIFQFSFVYECSCVQKMLVMKVKRLSFSFIFCTCWNRYNNVLVLYFIISFMPHEQKNNSSSTLHRQLSFF